MPFVPVDELFAVDATVLARLREIVRGGRVEPREISVVERDGLCRWNEVPFNVKVAESLGHFRR